MAEGDPNWVDLKLVHIRPADDYTIIHDAPSGDVTSLENKLIVNKSYYFDDLNEVLSWIFIKYNQLAGLFAWTSKEDIEKILIPKNRVQTVNTSGVITVNERSPFYFGTFGDPSIPYWYSDREDNLIWLFDNLHWYDPYYTHPSITRLLWEAAFGSAIDATNDDDLFARFKLYMCTVENVDLDFTFDFVPDHRPKKKNIIKILKQITAAKFKDYCKKRWNLEYTDEASFCRYFLNYIYFNQWYELVLIVHDMLDGIQYLTTGLTKNAPKGSYLVQGISDSIQEEYGRDDEQVAQIKDRILSGMENDGWQTRSPLGGISIGWQVTERTGEWPGYRRTYEAAISTTRAYTGEDLDTLKTPIAGWAASSILLPPGVQAALERRQEDFPSESICETLKPILQTRAYYDQSHYGRGWYAEEDTPNPSVPSSLLSSIISAGFIESGWVMDYDGRLENRDLVAFIEDDEDEDENPMRGFATPLNDVELEDRMPDSNYLYKNTIKNYEPYTNFYNWYEDNYEFFSWTEYGAGSVLLNIFDLQLYSVPDDGRFW